MRATNFANVSFELPLCNFAGKYDVPVLLAVTAVGFWYTIALAQLKHSAAVSFAILSAAAKGATAAGVILHSL